METLGTIDEATSALGLARAQIADPAVGEAILALQRDLYLLMAELASPPENYEQLGFRITAEHLARLDGVLEDYRARTRIGHQFIIPGATVAGAALDLARTIVRRGERQVARLLHDGVIGNAEVLSKHHCRVLIAGSVLYGLGLAGMALATSPFVFTLTAGVLLGAAQAGTTYAVIGAISALNAPPSTALRARVSVSIA